MNNDIICTAGGVPNPDDKTFIAEFIKKDIDNINNRINLIIQRTREEEICDEDMMIIIALQSQLKEKEKLLKIIKGKNDKESK